MLLFNQVAYYKDKKTITVQSGATWEKVQAFLAQYNRSIKVMQSDNIFTVGGSVSVNAHGWQVNSSPLGSTIVKMTIITADAELKTVSPTINSELFYAIIGGYGLFGVIVDVEMQTVANNVLKFNAEFTNIKNLSNLFENNITLV